MKIFYTRTFKKTLHRAVDFLLLNTDSPEEQAVDLVSGVTLAFEKRMSAQPLSCQPCRETEKLGVMGFREYHKGEYRVIYTVRGDEIMALLFLHQKQSIQKALVNHCLAL